MPPASRGLLSLLRCRIWSHRPHRPMLRLYSTAVAAIDPFTPPKIVLRQYQEDAIQSVLSHLDQGHKRLGISLATGSGKTVIFTQLIDRVAPRSRKADQTLILAHRRELVEQAARHCQLAYPDKSIGIELGNLHAIGNEDIVVASMQSVISGDRIEKFNPERFKLVLVDEAHHIVSSGYMRTLEYFGLDEFSMKLGRKDSPALVGVSATLSRFDGLKLGAAIDQIVYHKDYIDMIGEKWLSDVVFTTVKTNADLSRIKLSNGDFQASELSKKVNTDQVNEVTVRAWMHKVKAKSTIVFCVDLEHVSGLTNTFRRHGIDARYVTSNTTKSERGAILDAFKAGEFPVIVNCGVFTEGTDIPNIDCVLLARPTRSRNLLVQMIGRGMRLHPGKTVCHIVDLVASLEAGIVSTPTLFGLDPGEVLDGASVDDMKKLEEQKRETNEVPEAVPGVRNASISGVTYTDYNSVYDLIEDTSKERHIRALSPHTWVEVGPNKYVLESMSSGYLTLEKKIRDSEQSNAESKLTWTVTETARIVTELVTKKGGSPFRTPREIAHSDDFSQALRGADTFASKRYPRRFISKGQPWRDEPATSNQLAFLNKVRPMSQQLKPEDLKKGKAGDMITKLKHGAKGRFTKLEGEKRRLERAREKEEAGRELRMRERVVVGPVPE